MEEGGDNLEEQGLYKSCKGLKVGHGCMYSDQKFQHESLKLDNLVINVLTCPNLWLLQDHSQI